MKLSELMQGKTPNADYEGFVTCDDMVLAVDITGAADTADGDFVVVQMGVEGLDAQNSPKTVDKQYIRAGQSTLKTGSQRTFKITGDRYIGDAFQDFACAPAVVQGVGQAVVVPYLYFCLLTGKGERGTASVIVNSDGSGKSGDNAAVDIELKKCGAMPSAYTYAAE